MRARRVFQCLVLLMAGGIACRLATAQLPSAGSTPSIGNANSALPEPIAWRQLAFSIPFKIAADTTTLPAEVRLYVSKNLGGNWELVQKVGPQERSFLYRAAGDGEYWFQIRTTDKQGLVTPEVGGAPELRVIVDTQPPRLELSATRGAAHEIKATWQAVDPLLDADSLKIEYQNSAGQWRPVAVDRPRSGADRSTTTGTLTWFPDDAPAGSVMVRAEISDRAGNVSPAQARADEQLQPVQSPAISSPSLEKTAQAFPKNPPPLSLGYSTQSATGGPRSAFSDRLPLSPKNRSQPAWNSTAQSSASAIPWQGEQSATPWPAGDSSAPQYGRHPIPSDDNLPPHAGQYDQSFTKAPAADRLAAAQGWENANPAIQNQAAPMRGSDSPRGSSTMQFSGAQGAGVNPNPQATSPNSTNTGLFGSNFATAGTSSAVMLPAGIRPLMVNSRMFDMDYEVDAVGPAGIAKVELWGTQDGGRTWQSYGTDPDNRSPIRAKVDGEGLYGFRVVVQSGSGLGGSPPNSGDRPDIWVQVDLTKPLVELIDARAGQGQDAGTLLIRWQASDSALAARPITLSFSEQPGGPWSTIAAGLDNTGQYAWRPDSQAPDRIYLRIEARDEAGNVGAFETPQWVSLERTRPGGRIQNVRPINDSADISHSYSDTASGARIYQFRR